MKKKVIAYFPLLAATTLGMVSCSEDTALNNDVSKRWQEVINGQVDAQQNWVTAIDMQLDILAKNGSTVKAYSIGREKPVLLGQKNLMGNGVMRLDVPQGIGNSIGLVCETNGEREYQRLYLSNGNKQQEDVDFIKGTNSSSLPADEFEAKAQTRVVANPQSTPLPNPTGSHDSSLNGTAAAATNGYSSFGGWAWEALLQALPETVLAEVNNPDGVSYEFDSDGYQGQGVYGDNTIVSLSYLYGYTGSRNSCVIGYYTHSDGTYSDLKMHDLGETITKDYLASPGSSNYQAKVQYQLDGTNKWYDANFFYTDGEGVLVNEHNKKVTATATPARVGDGIFNTYLVHNNYGERVSAMRGLSYKISIPKGLKYGFYLRLVNQDLTDAHKKILQNKGVDLSTVGDKEVNFSNADLNMLQNTGSKSVYYRSSYKKYDQFSFIGFDDSASAGDADCNDVTLGFLDADGKPGPHVFNPDEEVLSWTIGYENLGMDLDFDFNDVVIRVTPNPVTHKAKVELLAAGGAYATDLYFGTQKLCEVHEAFGLKPNSNDLYEMVNTGSNTLSMDPVDLGEVDWPSDYTMSSNGAMFNTKVVTKGGKNYTSSPGTFIDDDKDVPTAVCVIGDWAWPIEKTNIFEAYPLIGEWGKNVKNKDYWNWYSQPKSGKTWKIDL